MLNNANEYLCPRMPFSGPNLCMFPARCVCMTDVFFFFLRNNNRFVNSNKDLFLCWYFGAFNTGLILESEHVITSSKVFYLRVLREVTFSSRYL